MRSAKLVGILLATFFFWGCKKNIIDPAPAINFVDQDRNTVLDSGKGNEIIQFRFTFADGDADVGPIEGSGNPNPRQNIVFIDSRDTNQFLLYDFPPIPQSVASNAGISGSFEVYMESSDLIARTDSIHEFSDTVTFEVYVFDKEDNVSNRVKTDPIIITK